MPKRPLNSDELGRKGECRFEDICTDTKLVANRATVDRKGWDYLVEWHQPAEETKYDERDASISVRVQVKTVWKSTNSIKLRLSSAEAIAKDHRPAFIYVVTVDSELQVADAHIIHCDGLFLEDLLRRLRQARMEGKQPNRIFYSVPLARFGEAIELSGHTFRRYVESCVPDGMLGYATAKQAELDQLGGGKGRMRFKTKIAIESDDPFDEAAEFFLGRREAKVVDVAAFGMRFGIEIPDAELSGKSGTMRLSPEPVDKCTILMRRAGGHILRFRGDMFRAPRFASSPSRGRVLIRTPAFDLTLDADLAEGAEGVSMNWALENKSYSEINLPADQWGDICLFIADMGEATLEIQPDTLSIPLISTSVQIDDKAKGEREQWRALAQVSNEAGSVLRYAGCQDWQLPVAAIFRERRKIQVLNAMINAPSTAKSMVFEQTGGQQPKALWPDQLLYIDRLELNGEALAFAAALRLTGTDNSTTTEAEFSSLMRLDRIGGSDDAFWEFADRARTDSKIQSYYIGDRG